MGYHPKPPRGSKVVVTGGRDFFNRKLLFDTLDRIHTLYGISELAQGGANGADRLALAWARLKNVPHKTFEADWSSFGRAAGMLRNEKMLDEFQPDLVVAFPGGKGTENCTRLAHSRGILVWVVNGLSP